MEGMAVLTLDSSGRAISRVATLDIDQELLAEVERVAGAMVRVLVGLGSLTKLGSPRSATLTYGELSISLTLGDGKAVAVLSKARGR
ncbi:MAG: hypothetical protein ABWK00_05985 [Desulfurococcaceae archaeon]